MSDDITPEQDRWARAVWFTAELHTKLQDMCDILEKMPPEQRPLAMQYAIVRLENNGKFELANLLRQVWEG